jgi:hypothetical protein
MGPRHVTSAATTIATHIPTFTNSHGNSVATTIATHIPTFTNSHGNQ